MAGESPKIPEGYPIDVCLMGRGPATCAYFSFGLEGALCAKGMPDVRANIEARLADGSMTARGDNCSGPPDFTVDG